MEMRDVRSLGSRACGQVPDWKMEGDEEGEQLLATVGSPSRGVGGGFH